MDLTQLDSVIRVMWKLLIILMFSNFISCNRYSHEWAVQLEGGPRVAREVAERNNFEFLGQVRKTTKVTGVS